MNDLERKQKTEFAGGRNECLDRIRAAATFLVVLNHTVQLMFPLHPEGIARMSGFRKLFGIGLFTAGRLGVPLFLFLSGYLLLPRKYDTGRIRRFYRHNLIPLLVSWEAWCLVYEAYMVWWLKTPFQAGQWFRRALFLEYEGMPHSWYIPMILGVYLFLPFVAMGVQQMEGKILFLLLGMVYLYRFCLESVNLLMDVFHVHPWNLRELQLDLNFSGDYYGFYLVLGYCFWRYRDELGSIMKRAWAVILVTAVFAVSAVFTVWIQIRILLANYDYNVWYTFFIMPVLGSCAFLLLCRLPQPGVFRGLVTDISVHSFGVFLVHVMVIGVLLWKMGLWANLEAQCLLVTVLTFVLSVGVTKIGGKIPLLRTLLLVKNAG